MRKHRSPPPFTAAARRLLHAWVVCGLAIGLAACGSVPRSDRPAQVEQRGQQAPETASASSASVPQIAAYIPPASPQIARPQPARAVQVLQERAADQQRQGDYAAATVSLERALRIAPDDAVLWHRLADVRRAQQRYDLVAQLAAKSNSLAAASDTALQRANWSLIAEARQALGDSAGAREARLRADTF
jgi:tetratricopeptide (TPR) repeat protein